LQALWVRRPRIKYSTKCFKRALCEGPQIDSKLAPLPKLSQRRLGWEESQKMRVQ
jgi:hypothetical protein